MQALTLHLEKSACYLVSGGEGEFTLFLFLSVILLEFWEGADSAICLVLLPLTRCPSHCLQKKHKGSTGSLRPAS